MRKVVKYFAFIASALMAVVMVACKGGTSDLGYVIVSDYVTPSSGEDVSEALQQLIDANPNRTIYFPDGEYIISKHICSPA